MRSGLYRDHSTLALQLISDDMALTLCIEECHEFCCCVARHTNLHFSVAVLTNYSAYFQPNLLFHMWIVGWNSYWDGARSHTLAEFMGFLNRKCWGCIICKYAMTQVHRQKPATIDELKKTERHCVHSSGADDLRHGGKNPQKMQYLQISWKHFFKIPIKTDLNSFSDVIFFSMNHSLRVMSSSYVSVQKNHTV